mgnify:CR=1 FL=1
MSIYSSVRTSLYSISRASAPLYLSTSFLSSFLPSFDLEGKRYKDPKKKEEENTKILKKEEKKRAKMELKLAKEREAEERKKKKQRMRELKDQVCIPSLSLSLSLSLSFSFSVRVCVLLTTDIASTASIVYLSYRIIVISHYIVYTVNPQCHHQIINHQFLNERDRKS